MNTQQHCCEELKILQRKRVFPFSTVALYDAGDIAGWLILGIITHFWWGNLSESGCLEH